MRKRILLNILMVVASMAVIALILGGRISSLQESNGRLQVEIYKAKAAAAEAAAQAAQSATQAEEQQRQEHAELIKLRGEVAALRKMKEEHEKLAAANQKRSMEDARAVGRAISAAAVVNPDATDKAMALVDRLNRFTAAPPEAKGAEVGKLRLKMINHETLTPEDQAILNSMAIHATALDRDPAQFASFQSSFVGSTLGWSAEDPRSSQLHELISKAAAVAKERNYDYNSPSQNSGVWSEAQTALNRRVTATVQQMLTPEERTLFDSAFIGILGVDYGVPATK